MLKVPNGALRFKPQAASGQSQRQSSGSGRQAKDSTIGTVWKVAADKSLQPVQVKLGITDHTFTQVAQVLSGSLNTEDQVAIGSATSNQQKQGSTGAPGVGGAPRGMGGLGR